MSDLTSRPYNPDPERCCEACIFGRGAHAAWPHWVTRATLMALPLADFERLEILGADPERERFFVRRNDA